jgi:hypothetical protein
MRGLQPLNNIGYNVIRPYTPSVLVKRNSVGAGFSLRFGLAGDSFSLAKLGYRLSRS